MSKHSDEIDSVMRSVYAPLYRHLCDCSEQEWRAEFSEVERILGVSYPRQRTIIKLGGPMMSHIRMHGRGCWPGGKRTTSTKPKKGWCLGESKALNSKITLNMKQRFFQP